jgi:CheY-like chemotaxis protein
MPQDEVGSGFLPKGAGRHILSPPDSSDLLAFRLRQHRAEKPMAIPHALDRQGSRLRAVLIDPYAGSREGLRASLEAEGCLVEAAADARQAMALIRAGGFDLGVIDLDLSPARGIVRSVWELARLFRVFNPSAPVVLFVAELGRNLEAQAVSMDPALLLEKPINPARLRAVVRQLRAETARG